MLKQSKFVLTSSLLTLLLGSFSFAQTSPVSPGMESAPIPNPAATQPGTDPHTGEGAGAITNKTPKKSMKKVKSLKAPPVENKKSDE